MLTIAFITEPEEEMSEDTKIKVELFDALTSFNQSLWLGVKALQAVGVDDMDIFGVLDAQIARLNDTYGTRPDCETIIELMKKDDRGEVL